MLGNVVFICSIGCECVKQVTHEQQIEDLSRNNETQEFKEESTLFLSDW